MRSALHRTTIEGVKANVPAHLRVIADDRFRSGDYDTGLLGSRVSP
jgi:acetyl/propionyl-CoA carboxylase alpha subunit